MKGVSILHDLNSVRPRTCLVLSDDLTATKLRQFCSQDLVAARISYKEGTEWNNFIVASVYLPYDSVLPPPSKEVIDLLNYSESQGVGLLLCCDANAQNIIWGSTKCNRRGNQLFDLIVASGLNIQNVRSKSTFVTNRRQ